MVKLSILSLFKLKSRFLREMSHLRAVVLLVSVSGLNLLIAEAFVFYRQGPTSLRLADF